MQCGTLDLLAKKIDVSYLANQLCKSQIGTIILDFSDVGDKEAIALANCLKLNSLVHKNGLRGNEFGVKGLEALLLSQTNVYAIDLSCNHRIGDEAAPLMAQILKSNNHLCSIDLSENNLADKGAVEISTALLSNTSVCTLNLTNNSIGILGALALAKVFNSNTSLVAIKLDENNIADDGAVALANALISNSTVEAISLTFNRIGKRSHCSRQLSQFEPKHQIPVPRLQQNR